MPIVGFFEAHSQQNIIKTKIVTQYFKAWSRVMLGQLRRPGDRLAYIDLFAGPGRFEDGQASTPLWVLETALESHRLCKHLVTIFNDKNPEFSSRLQDEILSMPGVERLANQPQVTNIAVGAELTDLFRGLRLIPTLFFIDPWGYKGLSIDLIGATIRNWGCDCIFFFNYNRINPGISNSSVVERMNELFGRVRADELRAQVANRTPDERQNVIIDALTQALGDVGGKYVLPFEFESQSGQRPSHYIIFVSKAFLGYHIMKEVMAAQSSDDWEVKQFQYVPIRSPQMSLLPGLGRTDSIKTLKRFLVRSCAGTTKTVREIYEGNTVGTPYTLKNVKDAIRELEEDNQAIVDPPAHSRPKRNGVVTLADNKRVTFPPMGRTHT